VVGRGNPGSPAFLGQEDCFRFPSSGAVGCVPQSLGTICCFLSPRSEQTLREKFKDTKELDYTITIPMADSPTSVVRSEKNGEMKDLECLDGRWEQDWF
jgi:hypothetical protein